MTELIISEVEWWTTIFGEINSFMEPSPSSKREGLQAWHAKYPKIRFVGGRFYVFRITPIILPPVEVLYEIVLPGGVCNACPELADQTATEIHDAKKTLRIELTIIILAFVVFPWLTLIILV